MLFKYGELRVFVRNNTNEVINARNFSMICKYQRLDFVNYNCVAIILVFVTVS